MSLTERLIELAVWWTATIAALAYIWHLINTSNKFEPRHRGGQVRLENTETTQERESA
jgi:hypothetical protein